MYPIFPTIDLKDEHVYDAQNPYLIGFNTPRILANSSIQTIFNINDDELSRDLEVSRLIMFAFGTAFAQAQILKDNQVFFGFKSKLF